MLAGYRPARATAIASALRSVAKISKSRAGGTGSDSTSSVNTMASVYASSPVEQPTTQARNGALSPVCRASSSGKTESLSCYQTSGSRKTEITPISISLNIRSISWLFCRKKST